jgi:1-acyl-sn-glycerol-3-phosphate acyltransferase
VIKLLLKARVPVVIAGIRGTHESLPRGAKFPRFSPIRVTFSSWALPSSRVEETELSIRREMEVLLRDE